MLYSFSRIFFCFSEFSNRINIHFCENFTEWQCFGTITHRTIARLGYLRFWFCRQYTNAYVCIYEIIICTCRRCVFSFNCIRLWPESIGVRWCLLPFRWSKGVATIFTYWKSLFMEWSWFSIDVHCFIPYNTLFIIKTTCFVLNKEFAREDFKFCCCWKYYKLSPKMGSWDEKKRINNIIDSTKCTTGGNIKLKMLKKTDE